MANSSAFEYINTVEQLQSFCEKLSTRPFMVIDTEFLRESTYRPQLCLVQIKSDDLLALIDAIEINDLSPLTQLLHNKGITKVLHAASQDLEIFYWLEKKVPGPLFDTQIAAPLLGYAEQIGYGNLVKEMLNVELSKAHTRADWSRRPLPENQLQYALDDVIYLEQLYRKMESDLQKSGRLQWLEPEFVALEQAEKYQKPARDMWKKMRAAQKLKGAPLSVLQALAEWRELQARESNLPRNWLVKDDVLVDIARQMPDTVAELQHIRGLSHRVKKQFADRLVKVIVEARQREPAPLPAFTKKKKLTPSMSATVDLVSVLVTLRASELEINPALLATRKMLEDCVTQGNSESIKGWRQPLIGDEINELLEGKILIQVHEGNATVTRA